MPSHSHKPEPCIYVIDIDGTLIGDISLQVCEWEILQRFERGKVKQFRQRLIEHLRSGMLRPFVSDFITTVKQSNEHTEFFLYTASEDKWAQFLVPCIEAACGHKFGRPIFSRKHCLSVDKSLRKSLIKISSQIFSKLKQRYHEVFTDAKHMAEHMVLIDNNHVLIDKESKKAIICPSYEHTIIYDILKDVSEKTLHSHAYQIAQILEKYAIVPSGTAQTVNHKANAGLLLQHYYYQAYVSSLKKFIRKPQASRDRFWLQLASLIQSLSTSSKRVSKDSMIKYINTKVHSHSTSNRSLS